VAVVRPERAGMASGANNTFRQVGIATGIAALGTVFETQVRHSVTSSLLASPAGAAALREHGAALGPALVSGQVRTAVRRLSAAQAQAVLHAYRVGFASSLDHLVVIAAVVAFAGGILSYALVRQRDFATGFATGQGGAPEAGGGGSGGGPGRPSTGDGADSLQVASPA
jgi:hypothetical protein